MPSIVSTVLRMQMRMLKPIIVSMDVEATRSFQNRVGRLCAHGLASKVNFDNFDINGIPACFVTPNIVDDVYADKTFLYLHGGAYVAGNVQYARGFAGVLAESLKVRVLCIGYRLAPESPFPAALEDALAAYSYLLQKQNAGNITLVGESAGGGLVFSLMLRIKEERLPKPRCLVAISPWTDLTMSGDSYVFNEKSDPTLSMQNLSECADMYAGGSIRNPLVSPIFGDFTDFPPSLIIAGGTEMLLDDSRCMAARLNKFGAPVILHIEEGMWHSYVLFGVPEAVKAVNIIRKFTIDPNITE